MKNPPAFQYYPAEWSASTRHLDPDEDGAYHRLVDVCWMEDGLPDDDEILRKITGVKPHRWSRIRENVLAFFQNCGNGRLHHKRLQAEMEKQRNYRQKQQKAGKKRAHMRWHNDSTAIATPMANDSSPSPTPSLSLTTLEDVPTKEVDHSTEILPTANAAQIFPPGIAGRERDYQLEVLAKCGGRTDDAIAGMCYTIGRHVPAGVIHQALASMQDKRLQSMNPDEEARLRDPTAYYFATLESMCKEQGIALPQRKEP